MNKYQIFLASSIREFKDERDDIGDFIRKVQDVLIDDSIKLKLFECEFFDNSITLGRKQEEYNEEIRKSDAFVMLVGQSLGKYTLEEYQIAVSSNVPKIFVLFKDLPYDESVKNFKDELHSSSQAFSFSNTKQMKACFAQVLKSLCGTQVPIAVDESGVTIHLNRINF